MNALPDVLFSYRFSIFMFHEQLVEELQLGMLVLIDRSQHDWLEGRGPRLCLHAAIDDATGRFLAGCFRLTQDFEGYRQMLLQLVIEHGIPLAIYSDRHTLFCSLKKSGTSLEHQLLGQPRPRTQIGRILCELGKGMLFVSSQA